MSREHWKLTGNKTRGECIATRVLEVKTLGMLQAYLLLPNVYAAAGERGFQEGCSIAERGKIGAKEQPCRIAIVPCL